MTTSPQTPGIRVSDAERDAIATRLQDAAAEGRLSTDELDERLEQAYAARYEHDLAPLTVDLPTEPATVANENADTNVENAAEPRKDRHHGVHPALRIHAVVVAVMAVMIIGRWVAFGAGFFWPVFPIFWLTMSLVVHAAIRRQRLRDVVPGRAPWHRRPSST